MKPVDKAKRTTAAYFNSGLKDDEASLFSGVIIKGMRSSSSSTSSLRTSRLIGAATKEDKPNENEKVGEE